MKIIKIIYKFNSLACSKILSVKNYEDVNIRAIKNEKNFTYSTKYKNRINIFSYLSFIL